MYSIDLIDLPSVILLTWFRFDIVTIYRIQNSSYRT